MSYVFNQPSPAWFTGRWAGGGDAADAGGYGFQGGYFFGRQSDGDGGRLGHLCLHRVLMVAQPALNYLGSRFTGLYIRLQFVAVRVAFGAFFVMYFLGSGLLFHFLSPISYLSKYLLRSIQESSYFVKRF